MITLLYAGLCTLLVMVLTFRVILARRRHRIGLGDGGNEELRQRIRAHGNAVEYLPLALILLGGMELTGYDDAWIHGFGATLFVSRVLHAWGLSRSEGVSFGRFVGTFLTLLPMGVMAIMAVAGFFLAM